MNTLYNCPICKKRLTQNGGSYKCESRHSFDISSDGYINLAVGKSSSGDNKMMCRARRAFLSAGYYKPFADAICSALTKYSDCKAVCDAGCYRK